MNGWTPSITLGTRVKNLFDQIPVQHRASASLACYGEDDHDFERKLTGYVISREWEKHPADVATDLEAQYEKPQADKADWFTKSDSIISREFDPAWEIHCQEVNDTRATDYPM